MIHIILMKLMRENRRNWRGEERVCVVPQESREICEEIKGGEGGG